MTATEQLKASIASGKAIVVVGTGVTVAATRNAPCANWRSLIEHGIDFLQARDASLPEHWATLQRQVLDMAIQSGRTDDIVSVASTVGNGIRALGEVAYADWLRETVGALQPVEHELLDAIRLLRTPIATTNYDTLLENHLRLESASWLDAGALQNSFIYEGKTVGHLHGVWNRPESVILTESDYATILTEEGVQALQRGALTLKSLIYIGFGAGLSDPNFSKLLEWHRRVFSTSHLESYRLCTTNELAELERIHVDDKIKPVAYGDAYENLANFLEGLAPEHSTPSTGETGLVRDVQTEAREGILDDLRSESIIAEHAEDTSRLNLDELLIAPTLLQLPDSHYVNATDAGQRIEPLDNESELRAGGVIVLAAEESTGLTTALKWLLIQSCEIDDAPPVIVSARAFTPGARPLERAIRQEAHAKGVISKPKDPLPALSYALDDFNPHAVKVADQAFKDIAGIEANLVIIGCRQGDEGEITERLNALGIDSRVRYLAKLRSKSVQDLARMAAPVRFESIAAGVITIMRAEHLPFTPFTASLLISILVRGNTVVTNASSTTVLEQYLELLLGRGDLYEDARFSLSSAQLITILSDLARYMVERLEGAISEADAVSRFTKFFDQRGWRESPTEVLQNLINRRVLRKANGSVQFSQSSYVHLFAAKRATRDPQLLDMLSARPLYFGPILKDYAALTRDDATLLMRLNDLLDEWDSRSGDRPQFQEIAVREAPAQLEQMPDDADDAPTMPDSSEDAPEEASTEEGDDRDASLEAVDDSDTTPFPLTSEDGLPGLARHMIVLDLVSAALRDTDDLEDVALKKEVLRRLLQSWGELVNSFDDDESFKDGVRDIARDIVASMPENEDLPDLEDFIMILPPAMVSAGVSVSLSTRKLVVVLEELLQQDAVKLEPRSAFAAAVLTADIADPGWAHAYATIARAHTRRRVFQHFLLPYTHFIYSRARSKAVEEVLSELIVDMRLSLFTFKDNQSRQATRSRWLQQLRQVKELQRRREADGDSL